MTRKTVFILLILAILIISAGSLSTQTDSDGDGFEDNDDACPNIFAQICCKVGLSMLIGGYADGDGDALPAVQAGYVGPASDGISVNFYQGNGFYNGAQISTSW